MNQLNLSSIQKLQAGIITAGILSVCVLSGMLSSVPSSRPNSAATSSVNNTQQAFDSTEQSPIPVVPSSVAGLETDDSTGEESDQINAAQNPEPVSNISLVESGKVVDVIDGDTIKVNVLGSVKTIRLIGINAPEKGACRYHVATNYMEDLVLNKKVSLYDDVTQGDKDKYDRLLRFVFVGDMDANLQMVASGLAKEYTYNKPYEYQQEYQAAEAAAKAAGAEIWGDACSCTPKEISRKCNACNQAKVTYQKFSCDTYTETVTDYSCSNKCVTVNSNPSPTSSYTCSCSKTCGQMLSCDEAYYQLNTCGCSQRDGDGDGVPCEDICPGG